jgi:Aminoglycoside adenylyltransferase, C-terminal domain/Nucleotidyltransferase domain
MEIKQIKSTPQQDINEILVLLSEGLREIFGEQLVGLYLIGSLTYGDFHRGSSDIDFLVVLKNKLSKEQLEKVKIMHAIIGDKYPTWSTRMDGLYITEAMLNNAEPPTAPSPCISQGEIYPANYEDENEWVLTLHYLYESGVALVGIEPKKIICPVDIKAVREASKKDLHKKWEPKWNDTSFLQNSLNQAIVVLTLCRKLYREKESVNVVSKRVASAWVKKTYGKPWSDLIDKAENWQHGQEMNAVKETQDFIKFVLETIG